MKPLGVFVPLVSYSLFLNRFLNNFDLFLTAHPETIVVIIFYQSSSGPAIPEETSQADHLTRAPTINKPTKQHVHQATKQASQLAQMHAKTFNPCQKSFLYLIKHNRCSTLSTQLPPVYQRLSCSQFLLCYYTDKTLAFIMALPFYVML